MPDAPLILGPRAAMVDAPSELGVTFDHHGVSMHVRAMPARSNQVKAWLAVVATFVGLSGVVAAGMLIVGLWTMTLWFIALGSSGILTALAYLAHSVLSWNRNERTYELEVSARVLRAKFELVDPVEVDLREVVQVRAMTVDIALEDACGDEFLLPLGGHSPRAIAWVAEAIERARIGAMIAGDTAPAPAELDGLRVGFAPVSEGSTNPSSDERRPSRYRSLRR